MTAAPHQIAGLPGSATVQEVWRHHLQEVVADLHRLDPLVRGDAVDAVHQLRVRARRLRSTLRVFGDDLHGDVVEPVRADLAWMGEALGRPRDLEVLRGRLESMLAVLPAELVRGGIHAWLSGRLTEDQGEARLVALEAMSSHRYVALLDVLDGWTLAPPTRASAGGLSAIEHLPGALVRATKKVRAGVRSAATATGAERTARLHAVRRRAKRARYAAEVLVPILGAEAQRIAGAAERVQDVLGDHHDAMVAADHVARLAAQAHTEGRDTFTFGLLHAGLRAEAARKEAEFDLVWRTVRRDLFTTLRP